MAEAKTTSSVQIFSRALLFDRIDSMQDKTKKTSQPSSRAKDNFLIILTQVIILNNSWHKKCKLI